MSHLSHEDHTRVVLRKKWKRPQNEREKANAVSRGSATLEKRYGGGRNTSGGVDAKKIMESDSLSHRKIPMTFRKALMKARMEKKMTQKDLAKKLQVQASIVQKYEAGKTIPNGQIISKMNRILGTRLPKIPKKKKSKSDD